MKADDNCRAAAELQVSTKTIKRRLQAGDLQGQLIAHRWIIDMPDEVVEVDLEPEDSARSGSSSEPQDKRDIGQRTKERGQKGQKGHPPSCSGSRPSSRRPGGTKNGSRVKWMSLPVW